jgi:ribulose 1,5-bisphosphate synthetase/thiazole synthase
MIHSAQHAASYYAASSAPHPDHAFAGEHSADVCIVGGGYSGLNTAIELAERGSAVILLEARKSAGAPAGAMAGS